MSFDVDRMFMFCVERIAAFAREHPNETFYAFAIDADLLCLNSEEQFEATLRRLQEEWDKRTRHLGSLEAMTDVEERRLATKSGLSRSNVEACLAFINESRDSRRAEGCPYRDEAKIRSLKENTGDWAYQGFASFDDEHGFDDDLYQQHYYEAMDAEDGHAPHTPYAVAMTELVARLRQSPCFEPLKRSAGFYVTWVDHSY